MSDNKFTIRIQIQQPHQAIEEIYPDWVEPEIEYEETWNWRRIAAAAATFLLLLFALVYWLLDSDERTSPKKQIAKITETISSAPQNSSKSQQSQSVQAPNPVTNQSIKSIPVEPQDSATGKSVFGSLVSAYLGIATGMTPYALQVDAAVEAAKGNRAALDRIAAIAREETQPLLLLCKILGPNPRALVLGLSMFAGTPAYYMVYQSVVLNLLLVWSVSRHNAAAKRIAARIAG